MGECRCTNCRCGKKQEPHTPSQEELVEIYEEIASAYLESEE